MKKLFVSFVATASFLLGFAQTEKFDIASFIAPTGWQRADSSGVLIFHDYKTKNNLTSFCHIVLFPSRATKKSAAANFKDEWNLRVAQPTGSKVKPTTRTESTPEGWTVVTGFGNITQSGITYMKMLINATGYGRTMSVMVNTAGGDHATVIEKFFNDFDLDGKAALAMNQSSAGSNQVSTMNGSTSYSEYVFIAPQGWYIKNNNDYLSISQTQQVGQECLILIIPPQPSSGNLEKDARNVFNQMYPGWSFQFSGAKQYDLIKGFTSQGLEYCMMQAPMQKLNADGARYDGFEEGTALVIRNGNKIGIISARHNTSLLAHEQCRNKYNTWLRFLNSITMKSAVGSNAAQEPASKRIVGVWKLKSHGPAIGDYVFAANGNYQMIGGVGTSTTSSDDRYKYIHISSYAFDGDGSYSINGSQLKLMKRGQQPEQVSLRFEKINHGGTGWTDRIHMLKRDLTTLQEYEVAFEKETTSR